MHMEVETPFLQALHYLCVCVWKYKRGIAETKVKCKVKGYGFINMSLK